MIVESLLTLPELPAWATQVAAGLGGGIAGCAIGRTYLSSKLAWSAWGLAVMIFIVGPVYGLDFDESPLHVRSLMWFVFVMLLAIGRAASGHPLFRNRRW